MAQDVLLAQTPAYAPAMFPALVFLPFCVRCADISCGSPLCCDLPGRPAIPSDLVPLPPLRLRSQLKCDLLWDASLTAYPRSTLLLHLGVFSVSS